MYDFFELFDKKRQSLQKYANKKRVHKNTLFAMPKIKHTKPLAVNMQVPLV